MVNIPSGIAINTAVSGDRTTASGFRTALGALLNGSSGTPNPGLIPQHGVCLYVTSASSSALTFSISPGYAVTVRPAAPALGGYIVGTNAAVSITLAAANATNPRIDVVYICQPDPEAGDVTHARIDVLQGTPSATPAVPTPLPQGALALANILVPAAATAASACTITDKRLFTSLVTGIPIYQGDQTLLPANPAFGSRAVVTAPTGLAGAVNVTYRAGNSGWKPWESDWQSCSIGLNGCNGPYGATPGWLTSGSSFRFIDGLVRFRGNVSMNSGGTLTSQASVSLPVPASTAIGAQPNGGSHAKDQSAGYADYIVVLTLSSTYVFFSSQGVVGSGAAGLYAVAGTTPFGSAWAQSDVLDWDFTYDPRLMVTTLIAGIFATGQILQRNIPVKTGSCEVTLNAAGSITASVRLPVTDPNTGQPIPLVQNLVEGKSFLGYVQDDRLLNAGPIWTSNYDADTQIWTLQAGGARSYLDYRFILPLLDDANLAATPAGQSVTYSGLSLRTIAKRLLQNAIAANGGSFPVDFESDITDTNTRTYPGENMKKVSDAFSDLSGVITGPDIMLIPYVTADGQFVRWNLVTGNTEIRQSGQDWVWDTAAPIPNVTGVGVARSATTLATTSYEFGSTIQDTASDGTASTSTTLAAKRHDPTLLAAGFPRLETSGQHTDVVIQSTLQGYADDDVNAGRYYTDTYTVKSRIDLEPTLASISVGDYAQLKVKNHPILGTTSIRVRVIGITANRGERTASISCAPVRTQVAY